MRLSPLVLASLLVCSCDRSRPASSSSGGWAKSVPASTQPAYSPERFRRDVEALISASRYEDAVIYLRFADPVRQADHDRAGYLAVAWDAIVLPGADDKTYDRARDWRFPGTQDAIEHAPWQWAAEAFATRYNRRRLSTGG